MAYKNKIWFALYVRFLVDFFDIFFSQQCIFDQQTV